MEIVNEVKKVWGIIRSPKSIAAFKLAAAVVGVGVALEGFIKSLKVDEKK